MSSLELASTPHTLTAPLWVELSEGPRLDRGVLACIGFETAAAPSDDPRRIAIGLEPLDRSVRFEIWRSAGVVEHGREEGIGFSRSPQALFGWRVVPEAELQDTAAATRQAYERIAGFLKRQGYPWMLRGWNFLHGITQGTDDAERYRQFCLGRHQALSVMPDFERFLPAATVIGRSEPGLLVCFLAGKSPGIQIENPRQLSAFRYPREYGPRSPSFSRATLKYWGDTAQLLVSGT
ncbi:MAG: hypothetical protein L0Y32_01580, partial [Nevskiales bacterium]|nr:hypothetical protein [Nevskiales bacterium]